MNIVEVCLLCLYLLPFPIAFLYALIKRANGILTFTPFVISMIYSLSLYRFVKSGTGLHYLSSCVVVAIIGTVGLYYGFIRRLYYIDKSEVGLGALRCFLVCLTIIVFPLIPAGMWCWAVNRLHTATEKVAVKRPEPEQRPS